MRDIYGLNLQIKNNLESLQDNARKLKGLSVMQWAFTIGTFAIYFSFTTVIFGGVSVWGLQEYLFKNATNGIALVWVTIVIFVVPLALSLGKHFNYQSISDSFINRNRANLIIHSMIALALISGVYYEAISSSANLQAKAFNAVDYKGNLAVIMSSGNSVNADSGLSSEIASAQMKLAQCEERLKQGKEKHCEGAKAKLSALKEQSNASLKASAESSANTVTAKSDVLKSAVEDQALPASKWIAQTFGLSNDGGTMMIVIIAALFFELIHLTTVFSEIRALIKKQELKTNGEHLQNAYFNATGKVYKHDDFKDERVIDLSEKPLKDNTQVSDTFSDEQYEVRTKGKPYEDTKEGFGFVPQPKTAKFKYQTQSDANATTLPQHSFGFIPSQTRKNDENQGVNGKNANSCAGTPISCAGTPISCAGTRIDTRENEPDTRENEPLYTAFSQIPTYAEGQCKWCGVDLSGYRKGTKFCSTHHKNMYWNLYKPSNKRSIRDVL